MMSDVRNRLWEKFNSDEIVERPVHPLLLRAPDFLLGSEGIISALFTPQALEHGNPAHLLSRLIASRLALPNKSKMILLLSPDDQSRFTSLSKEFALTTGFNDQALYSFIRDQRDFGLSAPMDPDIQRAAVKQFDVTYAATENAFRLSRQLRKKGVDRTPGLVRQREFVDRRSTRDLRLLWAKCRSD